MLKSCIVEYEKFYRFERYVNPMEGVANLPKLRPTESSSSCGPLHRFQDNLVDRYMVIIAELQASTSMISRNCQQSLDLLIRQYTQKGEDIKHSQSTLLDSVKNSSTSFDSLKGQLQSLGDSLLSNSSNLKNESISLIDSYFSKMQPIFDKTAVDCKDFLQELPPAYVNRIPFEVKRINAAFLDSKRKMLKFLSQYDISCHVSVTKAMKDFESKTQAWSDNRVSTLISTATVRLSPEYPIDFDTTFQDFYRDQQKFSQCFKKLLQGVTLVSPPDKFIEPSLDCWWTEVNETLSLHSNFITHFSSKIKKIIETRSIENASILQTTEAELTNLIGPIETSSTIQSLSVLAKQSQKRGSVMLEKLSKYWENRKECVKKAFEAIRNFVLPLIQLYQSFSKENKKREENVNTEVASIHASFSTRISEKEAEFSQKSAAIELVISQSEIQNIVSECKTILEDIETEYRQLFSKTISIYDLQPQEVCQSFEAAENQILEHLKITKTESATEFIQSSRDSTSRKQTKLRKRPVKQKQNSKKAEPVLFNFALPGGAKYQEVSQLAIIPIFEDFSEGQNEAQAKNKQKSRKETPKKPKAKPPAKSPKTKGKVEEVDDIDLPLFSIKDFVPKIDGNISTDVFVPSDLDLEDWPNSLRKEVLSSLNERFHFFLTRAQYIDAKKQCADDLNERMRIHAPRATQMELGVASVRVIQIESRNALLEKHFRQASTSFNSSLAALQCEVGAYKQEMKERCKKVKKYTDLLPSQKSSQGLQNIEKDFRLEVLSFEREFYSRSKEVSQKIDSTVNAFNASNTRFIDTVASKDKPSEDEKQLISRLMAQTTSIHGALKQLLKSSDEEITAFKASIITEFENSYPAHSLDLNFLEQLSALLSENRQKVDTILFRERMQSSVIEAIIQKVDNTQDSNAQEMILAQISSLDSLRSALIQRARYNGLLKADLSSDPTPFSIDLSSDTLPEEAKQQETPDKKKQLKGHQRSKTDVRAKPSSALQSKKSADIQSIRAKTRSGQFEQLAIDFNDALNKTCAEYYAQQKSKKYTNTRPELIPMQLQVCVESTNKKFSDLVDASKPMFEEAEDSIRSQISRAELSAREATSRIFTSFYSHYTSKLAQTICAKKAEYKKSLESLKAKSLANKENLTYSMADPNKEEALLNLLDEENRRESEEESLSESYHKEILDAERHWMRLFTFHLPSILSILLSLFERWPMTEDIPVGRVIGGSRKTLSQLLRDSERKEEINESERVFKAKSWGTYPTIMKSFAAFQPSKSTEEVATPSRPGSKKRKKASERPTPNNEPAEEMMPAPSGLDTPLSRGAVVERNRCYEMYERALSERIGLFINELQAEREVEIGFYEHWRECAESISKSRAVQAHFSGSLKKALLPDIKAKTM